MAPTMLIQGLRMKSKVKGCNEVRINQPLHSLSAIPDVTVGVAEGTIELKRGGYDKKILVWQRPIIEISPKNEGEKRTTPLSAIPIVMRNKYLIVIDFDDHPEFMPDFEQTDHLAFRACHAIQTTKEELASFFRTINPNVAIFPNQIATLPALRKFDDNPQKELVVFFGAIGREKDWEPIMPAINRLIDRYKDRLRFNVIHDSKFFRALQTEKKHFTPTCDYETYTSVLQQSDICLMPLQDTQFNHAKSDLKFLEASSFGVVSLASPVVYEKVIEDEKTGLIFRSEEEFEKKFIALLENPYKCIQLASSAYHYVKCNRLLEQHSKRQYDWYSSLYDRLPELNAELIARTPEFKQLNVA